MIKKYIKNLLNTFFKKKLKKDQDCIFKRLTLNRDLALKKVKKIIAENLIDCEEIYEHWVIFSAISNSQKFKINKILEIGTYDGKTSLILQLLFPQSEINTIDLPANSREFRESYNRNENFHDFVRKRANFLGKSKQIKFFEINSLSLCNFKEKTYDLIWVDGCHGYPVVTADIINSYRLIKKDGIVMVDDVWISTNQNDAMYKSIASYQTLQHLHNAKLIKDFSLFLKRVTFANNINIVFLKNKKFIGFFIK